MLKCRLIIAVFVCLATAGFSSATSSQEYPNRPVRIVVPFPPGGVADPVARLVALKLQDLLGQPVVIENRSGASGTLGVDYVTKSDPDGYTILVATGDFITTPSLMPKTNYDPYKDLMPVTMLANAPLALLASIPSGFNSLNDVLTAARASPGKINFSSPGIGTINHLSGEWIGIAARVKIVHVPYRGGAPAATAVATGEVELGITTLPSALSYVQAGKAKIIGVMSVNPPSFASDLPTIAAGGLPEINTALWVGMFVPARTPASIVTRLNAEVQKVLQDPVIKERLNAVGTEANPLGPDAFATRIRSDADRYTRIIEQTGIKVER